MVDPRQVVGGEVWAKAPAVSRDFKRILGNQFEKTWVRGIVVRVEKRKTSDAAKRSTTYIVARYACEVRDGVQQYKEKEIAMQVLKGKDPNAATEGNNGEDAVSVGAATAPGNTNTTTNNSEDNAMPPLTGGGGVLNTPTPVVVGGGGEQQIPMTAATTTTIESTGTSSSTSTASTRVPVTESNGRQWFEGNTDAEVNGKPSAKFWKLLDQYGRGHEFFPGCDQGNTKYRALDYFFAVFPKKQLQEMQERTSTVLQNEGHDPTSVGEILKFFGILLIITRFEFGSRASLWSNLSRCRFIPAPNLGHTTGMSRQRFDTLWRYMVWSYQPVQRPLEVSHEEWRWMLVQDFVDNFNQHRETFYEASHLICADESMSRWYGLGGNWINMGLPHYVAMDRKPEDGCEIQNCCDGISGIMMRLKLVKSAVAEATATEEQRRNAATAQST